ncbi:MAG: tyrosine-type recombinase/integrase [Nannocystales bacterium]
MARASGRFRPRSPVFCTFMGREVQSRYVHHMCRRLRSKLGLSKRVHAHALRHTHAHELFREGMATKLIQLQLGHARLDSTDVYLRRIGANEAVAVVRARPIVGILRGEGG